jgi:hypothetical protein
MFTQRRTVSQDTAKSAFRQQILDVAETEREPEIEPDRLVNNLGLEAVSDVADFLHPLGYSATGRAASPARRDNAAVSCPDCTLAAYKSKSGGGVVKYWAHSQ